MTAQFLTRDEDGLLAEIDLGVYSLPALLRVAYRFTDRCYLHLQHKAEADPKTIEVRFRRKTDTERIDIIAGEFCNELLDQTLREIISRESEPERNLILAHALSRTSLLNPELETEDSKQPESISQIP